jgi:hypothetical protein
MKWQSNLPLYRTTGSAWFTPPSFVHLVTTLLFTWLIQPYTNYPIFIATFVHLIEELLENYAIFSMEGIWSRVTACTHSGWLDLMDSDSIQNMLGDVLAGVVGSLIAVYVLSRPATSTIVVSLFSIGMVYSQICKSLNLNKGA